MARWESDTRWYAADIQRDLFGDITIVRRWGGLHSKHCRMLVELADSVDAAEKRMQALHQRRLSRNPAYRRVE